MADYLKRVCRFFALMALAPVLVGFVGPWSEHIGVLLVLVLMPVALIALLVGTIRLTIGAGRQLDPSDSWHKRASMLGAAPVLFVLSIFAILPLGAMGNFLGAYAHLSVYWDRYEAIVAEARKNPGSGERKEYRGTPYSAMPGPPVRVLFNSPGERGFAGAIIYDPTGEVMSAGGYDNKAGRYTATPELMSLFPGMPLGCRHITGDYYNCWSDM